MKQTAIIRNIPPRGRFLLVLLMPSQAQRLRKTCDSWLDELNYAMVNHDYRVEVGLAES